MGAAEEYEEHHSHDGEKGGGGGSADEKGSADGGGGGGAMEREEMQLYTEASAFQGAAVVAMIERHDDDIGEEQKILEITMEDGVTMSLALDSGERRLNELGYRQELKRSLHFPQLYATGISMMSVFAGVVPMYGQGFNDGGPAGLIWYWWITALAVHLIALSMAEISSSFPTAGSLYFWAAALAGPKWGPLASFITAWMEFVGLAVGHAMVSYYGVTILQVLILISTGGANGNGFMLDHYEVFGIACGVVLICCCINCCSIRIVSYVMLFSALIQVLGAVALIITLPLVAPTHQPASFVFQTFFTNDSMPSPAYSFVICLMVSQYSLYGYDGVAHLSEETKKSDRTAPAAIVAALSTVTFVAWLLLVVFTLCIQNVDDIFASASGEDLPTTVTNGMQPVIQILWDAFYASYGSGLGAQIFTGIIYTSFFFGTVSGQLGASRVAYALARDNGLPLSFLWRKLAPNKVPVLALLLSVVIGVLFLLPLLFTSTTIFFAIASISSIGWVSAYSIPIFFRLIQKEDHFQPGPFYIPNYIGVVGGKVVHFLALLWVLYTMIVFMLPYAFPVTVENLNWAPVAIAAWIGFFVTWWVVHARFWFKGPVREIVPITEGDGGDKVAEGKME
ncbi:hypothetical protein CLOM_g643 [Closterium sp. NIES-68]|nr:hypothetical protein CLOM_g643 [Closterium sp. NIES-68]